MTNTGPSISLTGQGSVPTGYGNQLVQQSAGPAPDQAAFSPNTPPDTLVVTGSNGSYVPGTATAINGGGASGGDAANYVKVQGFNPANDPHVFVLNLDNNGSPLTPGNGTTADDARIAQIVSDINATYGSNVATALTSTGFQGQFAGYDVAINLNGVASSEYFAFNFSGYTATDANSNPITGVTVTDIAVVPEPTSLGLLALGGLGVLGGRRRRNKGR